MNGSEHNNDSEIVMDIVEQLRTGNTEAMADAIDPTQLLMWRAADEIARLRKDINHLEGARSMWQGVAQSISLGASALYVSLDHLRHGCTPSCTDECARAAADAALADWEIARGLEEQS